MKPIQHQVHCSAFRARFHPLVCSGVAPFHRPLRARGDRRGKAPVRSADHDAVFGRPVHVYSVVFAYSLVFASDQAARRRVRRCVSVDQR